LFGSIFVVLNRILLSIVWFGVQCWLGGMMTYVCLRAMWPSIENLPATFPTSTGMTLPQFIGFIVFYVIQLPILLLNPKQLRFLVMGSTAVGFVVQLVLLIWACATMKGFGSLIKDDSPTTSSLGWSFMYGITVTVSSITAGILSVCDFSRFARTPAAGQWPQFLGFLPAWLGNVFGIITVAATQQRFGAQLWSVSGLLVAIQDANPTHGTRTAVWFCGAAFLVSQLALNAAGNSFSGGCDMAALLPKWINIRRGQYLTAVLGLAINPWYLLSGASVFLSVMSGYSIFIQPSLGIIVAHYFVLQRQRIRVSDLYHVGDESIYWYTFGVNWRAFLAVLPRLEPSHCFVPAG
jgi:nucleobase:cation symporter-1, NCS1 family